MRILSSVRVPMVHPMDASPPEYGALERHRSQGGERDSDETRGFERAMSKVPVKSDFDSDECEYEHHEARRELDGPRSVPPRGCRSSGNADERQANREDEMRADAQRTPRGRRTDQ